MQPFSVPYNSPGRLVAHVVRPGNARREAGWYVDSTHLQSHPYTAGPPSHRVATQFDPVRHTLTLPHRSQLCQVSTRKFEGWVQALRANTARVTARDKVSPFFL